MSGSIISRSAATPARCLGARASGFASPPRSAPGERRKGAFNRKVRIVGARGNNLKNVTADIPLGTFTCITGVSGGGKSTLIIETLYKAAARKLNKAREHPAA